MAGNRYKNPPSPQAESPLFNGTVHRNVREQIIYPFTFTSIMALGRLASTCQKTEADTAFLRLMTAAVEAEPMSYRQEDETSLAAIAILKRHPDLLFVKGMVIDHVGRKIFTSPYQLFHGAGDVWALKQVHEEIIPHIDGGEAKAEVQFHEQFPNCAAIHVTEALWITSLKSIRCARMMLPNGGGNYGAIRHERIYPTSKGSLF